MFYSGSKGFLGVRIVTHDIAQIARERLTAFPHKDKVVLAETRGIPGMSSDCIRLSLSLTPDFKEEELTRAEVRDHLLAIS